MAWPFRSTILAVCSLIAVHGRPAMAQVSLADDIILAAQGKENAEHNRKSALGTQPGSSESPYRRSPGSSEIMLGIDRNRRLTPLPRLSRRPTNPAALRVPGLAQREVEHGLAPAFERLRIPGAASHGNLGAKGDMDDELSPLDKESGGDGLTLDAAIERYVHFNRELRTKFLELPQAEADVLTAGLRENPLLFYSSDGVPYGSYSRNRPGDITHGVSIVYPIDFSGKRRNRVEVARQDRGILSAQYQDAVRLGIDEVYTAYVDVLAARQAVLVAQRGLGLLDQLIRELETETPASPSRQEDCDDLTIERDLAAMSLGDEEARFEKAKRRLGGLLELDSEEADRLEIRGSLRVDPPTPVSFDSLLPLALGSRPDLHALRLGVERARAVQAEENAERFSDAYFLYTPFGYRDNSQSGELSSTSWGAGLFVSAPLFNRNQGNVRRAHLNVEQSQLEAASGQHKVTAEVRQAVSDFENSAGDLERLETVTLPAVRRKRDRAWDRLRKHQISGDAFLAVQRDTTSLVRYYRDTLTRHRRNTLKLNTAVGLRVVP
jgi:cobalt-zinc-cadmium efflux system outer membrane protein